MITPTLSLGSDNGNERAKLPVIGSDNGTPVPGNYTITIGVDIPYAGREFYMVNNSGGTITFTVNGDGGSLGFIVYNGEQFDERLPLFTSIVVVATGSWRWRVRGNAS